VILRFPLVAPLKEGYNPTLDLVKTVAFISADFPEIFGSPSTYVDESVCRQIERAAKRKDYASLKEAVLEFNEKVRVGCQDGSIGLEDLAGRPLSYEQASILLDQVYARAVTDPESLRQYKGRDD
jgi:hypothetical protein